MQVSPINTNCRFNSNVATTNANKLNVAYSQQLKSPAKTNNVSFGSWLIDDIYYAIRDKINSVQYDSRKKHVTNMQKKLSEDEVALSKKLEIPLADAKKMYSEELSKARIKHNWGNEKGLNRVMGYPEEKLNLIKTVVLPIVNADNSMYKDKKISPEVENAVPNVVLFYGPSGRGKSYMIEALMEHIGELTKINYHDTKVKTLDRDWGVDTEKDIKAIEEIVEHSSPKYRNIVYVKGIAELFGAKEPELTEALLYNMENSAKKYGVTWIVETNDPRELDGRIFNPKRLSSHFEIKTLEDFEKDDVMTYMWSELDRKDNSDHKEIIDYARKLNIEMYPPTIRFVVDSVERGLKPEKGYYDGERVSTDKVKNTIYQLKEELRTDGKLMDQDQRWQKELPDKIYIERMIGKHSNEIK